MKTDPKHVGDAPRDGTAEYLADCYRQIAELTDIDEIKRVLRERLYAMQLSEDPDFQARVKAAASEVAAGTAREGAMTLDEVAALRDSAR